MLEAQPSIAEMHLRQAHLTRRLLSVLHVHAGREGFLNHGEAVAGLGFTGHIEINGAYVDLHRHQRELARCPHAARVRHASAVAI